MNELVSVCIPTYNNEEYIGRTIDSILEQSYQNWELIIVDDCSNDGTTEIVKSYRDERIHLYINEKNLGMAGNWNRCVELSKGKHIKFICADDILLPECLEKEIEIFINNPKHVMVISDSNLITDKDSQTGIFPRYYKEGRISGNEIAKKSLILINYFGMPCAVMFRKDIFIKVGGFSEEFHYIVDFDLWLAMAEYGDIYVNKQILNSFRLRDDSNSGEVFSVKGKEYYEEHKRVLNKYREKYGINGMEYKVSLFSRRFRNWANGVYLRLSLRKSRRPIS